MVAGRIWALAAGGAAVVSVAAVGGYYVGKPSAPAPQQQAPAPGTLALNDTPNDQTRETQSPSSQSATGDYLHAGYGPSYGGGRSPRHRIGFGTFHDSLARYGRWEHSDRWGEVWQPEAGSDFHPYAHGHWVDTREFGWTFVSSDPWADVTYHYGRWVDDPDRGWIWIAGYVWSPGWVVWRSGGGHTGWMPMPPDREFLRGDEGPRHDRGYSASNGYGYRDWYGDRYDDARLDSQWVYVDTGHMDDPDYRRWAVTDPDRIREFNSQTRDVTNYATENGFVVNRSIDPRQVAQQSGHQVASVSAAQVIAKPQLVQSVDAGRQVAAETKKVMPAGTGTPNSAPPASPETLKAAAQVTAQRTPPSAPGAGPPASSPGNASSPTAPSNGEAIPHGEEHHHDTAAQTSNAPAATAKPEQPPTNAAPASNAAANAPPSNSEAAAHREEHHGDTAAQTSNAPAAPAKSEPPPASAAPASGAAQNASPSNGPSNGLASTETGRHEHRARNAGHGEAPPSMQQTPPAAAATNTPPSDASAAKAQPPADQARAEHRHGHGQILPSALPPGSPSPYAQTPNAGANAAPPDADVQDGQDRRKHKRHSDEPDQGPPR